MVCWRVSDWAATLADVIFQRDGRGAEVGAMVPEASGPFAAQVGELVDEIVHHRPAAIADQLVALQFAEQLIDEQERQLELLGHLAAGGVAAGHEELQGRATRRGCRSGRPLRNDRGSRGTKPPADAAVVSPFETGLRGEPEA